MGKPAHKTDLNSTTQQSFASSLKWGITAVLKPLASLKLTVVLFSLSIVLVFIGTLAQAVQDIDSVVAQYFRCFYVIVDFQVFFPKSFFPDWQKVPGRFLFPGGWTIGTALITNLLAAHTVRFKIQARGVRLWSGLGVIAIGMLLTAIVIADGNDKDGTEENKIQNGVQIQQIIAESLKASSKLINASSMRILWQLVKGTFVSVVLLGGCILLFKKRAGIVLLHGGIALMMIHEVQVYTAHVESQMPITEGETVNWSQNISKPELAIIDRSSDKHDLVTTISYRRLMEAAKNDEIIRDERLPFDLKVLQYMKHSEIREGHNHRGKFHVTNGVGQRIIAIDVPPSAGADSSGTVSAAAAYIQILPRDKKKAAQTWLTIQQWQEQPVTIDDKLYGLSLRGKRLYKPFSLHLIDVDQTNYIGTNTASNYSSIVLLVDKENKKKLEVKISMNNPLHYRGETFYQQHALPAGRIENGRRMPKGITVLQVVKNAGWMVPYIACMIVATGMLAHFGIVLLRFLNRLNTTAKQRQEKTQKEIAQKEEEGELAAVYEQLAPTRFTATRLFEIGFPAVILLFVALYMLVVSFPPRYNNDKEMNLYRFGQLPVVYQGRTKPLDSFARNHLRQLSHKQTFKDEENKARPAIQWLLDMVTRPKVADKYRVFRIDNLELLEQLGLPQHRKGFRYSYSEFQSKNGKLRQLVIQARAVPKEKKTVLDRKLIELYKKVQTYLAMRKAYPILPAKIDDARLELLDLLFTTSLITRQMPLAALQKKASEKETTDAQYEWKAMAQTSHSHWIREFARVHKLHSPVAVCRELSNWEDRSELLSYARKILFAHALLGIEQSRFKITEAQLKKKINADPPERIMQLFNQTLVGAYLHGMKNESLQEASESSRPTEMLINVFTAYRDKNPEEFNTGIDEYQQFLGEEIPGDQYSERKLKFENWFNYFDPIWKALMLYITAFVLVLVGWFLALFQLNKMPNRMAFLLVAVAFAMHTFALIARMYLSGRMMVTVTNLYSSAVFIGWVCCLAGLVFELLHRRLGIGNAVATVAGFSTLLIANFLAIDGDTLTVMVAVLDTSFWLATHVTTVTIGYAATYVSGLVGIAYVFHRLFQHIRQFVFGTEPTEETSKTLARIIYGTTCFAIFFSFVGTVLGGLWADDSWGRFWGWDPKENGALIIVIWNSLILHARWGKMVKDRGLALLAIGGNIVTSWSWFGVNLLGVGLHAYGFKSGIGEALFCFVLSQLIIILIGCTPQKLWAALIILRFSKLINLIKRFK